MKTASLLIGFAAAVASGIGCIGEVGGGATVPQGTVLVTDLPCEVETVLAGRCWACHGQTPMLGLPSLTSVAAFMAPSRLDPTQPIGAVGLARMQSSTSPMPPLPGAPATASEIALIAAWVSAGFPAGTGCAPICTSGRNWTDGNDGSPNMNPGMACILCHASDEGPRFSIAGTVYPTIHEPALCNGADGSTGAQVIITGADGRTQTLAPNSAGNFFSEIFVATPYRAKVISGAGEREMTAQQTSGDCNACHTQAGANGAPGRITVP